MSNKPDDISSSLQRELVLRSFNRDLLKMENNSGSLLNQIIGVGTKLNPHNNLEEPASRLYPTYFEEVLLAFEYYPIAQTFNINIEDAMAMGVDKWQDILRVGKVLAANKPPEKENEAMTILRELLPILLKRGGE